RSPTARPLCRRRPRSRPRPSPPRVTAGRRARAATNPRSPGSSPRNAAEPRTAASAAPGSAYEGEGPPTVRWAGLRPCEGFAESLREGRLGVQGGGDRLDDRGDLEGLLDHVALQAGLAEHLLVRV